MSTNVHGCSSSSSTSSSSTSNTRPHHPWRYGDIDNNSDENMRRILADTLGNVANARPTSNTSTTQTSRLFRRGRVNNTTDCRRLPSRRNDYYSVESGNISDDEGDDNIIRQKGLRQRPPPPPSPIRIPTTTTAAAAVQCNNIHKGKGKEEEEEEEEEPYKVTDPVVLNDTHWTMLEGGFICKLCDASVVHESQLRGHIEGKRHQKNINYILWEQSQSGGGTASTTGIPTTPKEGATTRTRRRYGSNTNTTATAAAPAAPTVVVIPQANNNNGEGQSNIRVEVVDDDEEDTVKGDDDDEMDVAFAWLDDYERNDYENQCHRQFWTDNGDLRSDGIIDILGIQQQQKEGEEHKGVNDGDGIAAAAAPAHCVYDAMYCCLCNARPDGWWKWTQHFKGKKHTKHVYSTRTTHIAYWQKLSAGTGLVYYYNHLDGYWCWYDKDTMPYIDYNTPWEVKRKQPTMDSLDY